MFSDGDVRWVKKEHKERRKRLTVITRFRGSREGEGVQAGRKCKGRGLLSRLCFRAVTGSRRFRAATMGAAPPRLGRLPSAKIRRFPRRSLDSRADDGIY